jgi:hypothetical protein
VSSRTASKLLGNLENIESLHNVTPYSAIGNVCPPDDYERSRRVSASSTRIERGLEAGKTLGDLLRTLAELRSVGPEVLDYG